MEYRQLQQDQQLAGTKESYTPGTAGRLNKRTHSVIKMPCYLALCVTGSVL